MKSIKYSVLLLGAVLMCLSDCYSQSGWFPQTSGTSKHLFGVCFTDDTTGFVVGGWPSSSILLRTTDAGNTWNPQTHPEVPTGLFGICFANSMHGWVVGWDSTILHTTDGGNTWTKQTYEVLDWAQAYLEPVFCIDTNTAWALGAGGAILHTTNGGDTWTHQPSGQSSGMWDIFFTDADTGFAVGGWCYGCVGSPIDYILRTTNGGATWTTVHKSDTVAGYYGVDFVDSKTGIVVGADGIILRTTDGGISWTSRASGTTEELNDVCFINADTGYVVGGDWEVSKGGIILRTEDGGKTWGTQAIPTNHSLWKIFFTSDSTGFVVGFNGTILSTTDGGGPVTPLPAPAAIGINEIDQTNYALDQNYPNPFNLETNIKFRVQGINNVTLKIYTVHGQEVTTLVNEEMMPGIYEVTWDARSFPSGVYFYRLEVGTYVESRKLVLIK